MMKVALRGLERPLRVIYKNNPAARGDDDTELPVNLRAPISGDNNLLGFHHGDTIKHEQIGALPSVI